jgi:aminoglycoside phosphotransferase (APT) family kinase protein
MVVAMSPSDLLPHLRAAGLIAADEVPEVVPLKGGVSSDISLVRARDRRFVVKRALAKLKVKDDWFADPNRTRYEQAWFDYVARFAPAAVPRLLHRAGDWFAMEYLDAGLVLWKDELLAGRAFTAHAAAAGSLLGSVHRASWQEPEAKKTFATGANFYDLRLAPYLVTGGQRLPQWREHFDAEASRLGRTELALVHGDYSPKNLMIGDGRLVVLDAEVAWFGDPVFDLAFLLTHLHLKALLHTGRTSVCREVLALVPAFWRSYCAALESRADGELEARTVRLLQLLLLARVHGKSPVEYLTPAQQALVTQHVGGWLARPAATVAGFTAAWETAIASP